jgi:hypothetical protein
MKQHNAAVDKRDCWGSARERERMKARFNIRQRVNHSMVQPGGSSSPMSSIQAGPTTKTEASDEVISKYLLYIRKGDRSKFSTTFMDRHFAVVSALHSIRQHILEKSDTLSETLLQATKLQGSKYSLSLEEHMESLSTFTLTEYAVWLGKNSMVSGMLHGGVNPCVRSSNPFRFASSGNASDPHFQYRVQNQEQQRRQQQQKLTEIGSKVLKRFFDSFPLRLSTYIVQRVVQMRTNISEALSHDTVKKTIKCGVEDIGSNNERTRVQISQGETTTFYCPICSGTICIDFRLKFRNCHHVFCELCFWKDMLSNIDTTTKREARDVVLCLVCGEKEMCDDALCHPNNRNTKLLQVDISHLSPIEKAELSLENFYRLPASQRELKATNSKKKKLSEVDHVESNWLEAVVPSLGSTQDVRLDKFSAHVERNAIVYVKGCLLVGVDINKTNEYGQSAVYVAAWRGYVELVKLLLDHGADASIPANGGSTISSIYPIACRRNEMKVLELVNENNISSSKTANLIQDDGRTDASTLLIQMSIQNELTCTALIPPTFNHPGAGSCFIDDALSPDTIEILLELFHSLPVDANQKIKKNAAPCSERSYYCDANGSLRRLLGNAVARAGLISTVIPAETVDNNNHRPSRSSTINPERESSSSSVLRVFPHMRFLNYSSSGTVLPPHIDLCRVNPFCRPSDKQNPKHRSTHTFILYLTDCQNGGETSLLEEVTADGSAPSLAKVSPRKGRLLIFPHLTPHEGMEVVDVPKILLRGELQINANVPL